MGNRGRLIGRSVIIMRELSVLYVALCVYYLYVRWGVLPIRRHGGAKLTWGERTWKHGGVGRRKKRTIQKKSEKFEFVLLRYPVSFIVVSVHLTVQREGGKTILFITWSYLLFLKLIKCCLTHGVMNGTDCSWLRGRHSLIIFQPLTRRCASSSLCEKRGDVEEMSSTPPT